MLTTMSWICCLGVKRTPALSGLASTLSGWSHTCIGLVVSGIGVPTPVMRRVPSCLGGASGAVGLVD